VKDKMAKDELQDLVEITNLEDIKKLGLEQYTPPMPRSVWMGARLPVEEDRQKALDSARMSAVHKGVNPTHFMASSEPFRLENSMVYAFVFYGPERQQDSKEYRKQPGAENASAH
jgi:hypothetical protein